MKFVKVTIKEAEVTAWINPLHIVQFYSDGASTIIQLSTPMLPQNGEPIHTLIVKETCPDIVFQLRRANAQ